MKKLVLIVLLCFTALSCSLDIFTKEEKTIIGTWISENNTTDKYSFDQKGHFVHTYTTE